MSYILEALRRSQAERERGHVPGLHAQPVAADTADDAKRAPPAGWMAWLAAGAGLAALLALLLWWTRPMPIVVVAAPVAASATAPAPVAAVPLGADAGMAPTPRAAPAPSLPIVVSAPPVAAAPAPSPSPLPSPSPSPAAATAAPALPPSAAAPRTARLLAFSDLSPDQRRELPQLVLGGSVWSDNAASRFVIFNGQIVREGQAAAQGVVVERIGPKGAQLRWRGLLFEVPL